MLTPSVFCWPQYRMINGFPAKDSREEGEDDDDDGAGRAEEVKKDK